MRSSFLFLLLPIFLIVSCGKQSEKKADTPPVITVSNPEDFDQKDAIISLDIKEISKRFNSLDWTKMKFVAGEPIPAQVNEHDVLLLVDLEAHAQKEIQIIPLEEGETAPSFTKRTQAEISHKVNGNWKEREYIGGEFQNVDKLPVPPEHTDHSWFIRYEGPGWESDKVGYRLYLDWRNATDIFGKKTDDLVLQGVGLDGFDSYHEPSYWGMDILKVGSSLGIGALGFWQGDSAMRVETTDSVYCEIAQNGDLQSCVHIDYYGWQAGGKKVDVTSELYIQAGSHLTRHDVTLSEELPNLCTGIVKHEEELLQKEEGGWGYIATWGAQSVEKDMLGMAIIYRSSDKQLVSEDPYSHVIVLSPTDKKLRYYFLAAWEQENNGIKTKDAFIQYLDETLKKMAKPVLVKL